jgi:hypothetical protein
MIVAECAEYGETVDECKDLELEVDCDITYYMPMKRSRSGYTPDDPGELSFDVSYKGHKLPGLESVLCDRVCDRITEFEKE